MWRAGNNLNGLSCLSDRECNAYAKGAWAKAPETKGFGRQAVGRADNFRLADHHWQIRS